MKVCNSQEEAEEYLNSHKPKAWKIIDRLGTPKKCFSYCSANKFCSFYRELMFGWGKSIDDTEEIEEEEKRINGNTCISNWRKRTR